MKAQEDKPTCCTTPNVSSPPESCSSSTADRSKAAWITGWIDTPAGAVPQVATKLSRTDTFGTIKARLAFRRMDYSLPSGLYAVAQPGPEDPVFVTANYKLSFDCLRSALDRRNGWILMLDTRGINVWCAAGKGTFGTEELLRCIETARLNDVVSHHRLIIPQLGAVGVSAHAVRKQSGFSVTYGPIRARDLPEFLNANNKATSAMRRITFSLVERLVLIPVELVTSVKYMLLVMAGFVLLSGLSAEGYSLARAATDGFRSVMMLLATFLAGTAVAPVLLPWLPGRAFALKGACLGAAMDAVWVVAALVAGVFTGSLAWIGWLAMIPAMVSFLTMNFTGATPYTSLSGVQREMRLALPLQIVFAATGLGLWIAGRFV